MQFPFGMTAAIAAAFFVLPASSQLSCGVRDVIVDQLLEIYRERRRASAVTADGALLEVFAADVGNWTILVTRPDGPTCVVVAGQGWQSDGYVPEPQANGV